MRVSFIKILIGLLFIMYDCGIFFPMWCTEGMGNKLGGKDSGGFGRFGGPLSRANQYNFMSVTLIEDLKCVCQEIQHILTIIGGAE